jgi:predicted phosphodiesterase
LGEAWESNLGDLLQDGPVDLVCCTGDVADWGQAQEYETATHFLEALLERLGLKKDQLFVIPGNHDIARPVEKDAWRMLRERVAEGVDTQGLSRWMTGHAGPPLGIESAWREQLLARQAAYQDWVRNTLGRPDLDPAQSPHGCLGYRAAVRLPECSFTVYILGLDTAWLAGDDADAGRLRLTEDQLMRLATNHDGSPLDGLRLALMHHPFHDLADGANCRRLLARHVDFVLRGHLHEPELETWADPDRQVRQLAAGCLYEGHRADQYPNACHVLTLTLDAEGHLLTTEVRFRAWSSRGGHWHDDDSLYRESRQGRLTWIMRQPALLRRGTNPYDPWTPATPPRFVGRQRLFLALETALEERRSVSIVGDWRMGKSSVLQLWSQRVQERGREVRWVSGEGPEGVSPGAFVQQTTGLPAPDEPDGAADILSRWADAAGRPGLPPLILVDEMDGMLPRFEPRFFERLRGMLGRLVLVLASRREFDRICQELGRTSPFHNRLELQWLGLLEPEAAEELIRQGEGLLGPGDPERMRQWAGRHPFYLELLGRHLIDARNRRSQPWGECNNGHGPLPDRSCGPSPRIVAAAG